MAVGIEWRGDGSLENGIFQRLKDAPRKQLRFEGERVTWIQASTLKELLDLKAQHPEAKLVVGNTEIGKGLGRPGACLGARDPLRNPGPLNYVKLLALETCFHPMLAVGPQKNDISSLALIFPFHVWG